METHTNKKFCSYSCRGEFQSNSDEWHEQVKSGLPEDHSAGENNPHYGQTGEDHPKTGTKLTLEQRRKVGPASGSDHYAWKGGRGIPTGPHWHIQRHIVLERDDESCAVCGVDANNVHHVTPRRFVYFHPFMDFSKVNQTKNLVVLCDTHHKRADRISNYWDQYPEEVTGLNGEINYDNS